MPTTTATTTFKRATACRHAEIWQLLQGAIARRKADGSKQWQNGYPNPDVVSADIARGAGFVLEVAPKDGVVVVVGYIALWTNDEPSYTAIDGAWSSAGDFVVFHRLAVASAHLGRGYAQHLFDGVEGIARDLGVASVRADTNHDNPGMLSILAKRGYRHCGVILVRDGPRQAFDLLLP